MVRPCRCLPTMYAKRTVEWTVPIRPLLTEILRWDSGWFWGGFGVVLGVTSDVPRQKLGKKIQPDHGSHRHPTAAMVPHPQHWDTQQSSNMLHNKSMSLKLEKISLLLLIILLNTKRIGNDDAVAGNKACSFVLSYGPIGSIPWLGFGGGSD